MIPTPEECNWDNTRPWSTFEHQVSDLAAAALARCDRLGLPGAPLNPPTNASLMIAAGR